MAKKKTSSTKNKQKRLPKLSKKNWVVLGSFLLFFGVSLLFAFLSYLFTWQEDQSSLGSSEKLKDQPENWLSRFGASISDVFIYDGFGIAAFIFAFLITLTGVYFFFNIRKRPLLDFWFWGIYNSIWLSLLLGFVLDDHYLLAGKVGYMTNEFLSRHIGQIGIGLMLMLMFIIYLIIRHDMAPEALLEKLGKTAKKNTPDDNFAHDKDGPDEKNDKDTDTPSDEKASQQESTEIELTNKTSNTSELDVEKNMVQKDKKAEGDSPNLSIENPPEVEAPNKEDDTDTENDEVAMEVESTERNEDEVDHKSKKLVEDFGEFDPTLELSKYQFPSINLLKDYNKGGGITIDQNELEENKNQIVNTLKNYKIGIAQIKATVGPTVTLYEIVPEAGIRIKKIKNLEDDIALSLSALGIRIIAPIPGRGTIGIEVPNQKPTMVPMRSVIASTKFQEAEMELPLALGKTISNETFVVDLAKMPHLLMAGATGQGKSVGLNVILTSLLYQKHPAEVKFVLVDPKKVELTLFSKIERHYLAKLPDTDEAIITDNTKVINTLNSLCIEMDERYELLKKAMVRNIKEYNKKYRQRKLNPEDGHKFMPYIVLVVDEFADLIMTAGKEVEAPIARLAQLARAIGIHLIIATQRPSVKVITGMIKANFPARMAFRVTSNIDSRTILDAGGASQLIGKGDMLFTQGNELTRLQCAFVDTPEVEKITEFIGSQKAYPQAHQLPEYVGEESDPLEDNVDERDKLFDEAAEVIVTAQQGSASLLQRKLKLGYNRAGRIIDQLEAAGVVGPFEGSKARQVLVNDMNQLNDLLNGNNEPNENQ